MESTEVHEFAEHMKEAGEAVLTHVALGISVLAVLVAMVTVLSHRSHTEAVLMQARASDIWAEYQAKSIRNETLAAAADLLSLQPSVNPAASEAKRAAYAAHIAQRKEDLAEEQKQAHEFEHEVEVAEHRASRYDLGEALLQIAVVLSSITLLTRKQIYFGMGLALGAAGLISAALAFFVH